MALKLVDCYSNFFIIYIYILILIDYCTHNAEASNSTDDRILNEDGEHLITEPHEVNDSVDFDLLSSLYGRQIIMAPTEVTEFVATVCTFLIVILMFGFGAMLHFLTHRLFQGNVLIIITFVVVGIFIIITTLVLSSLPQNSQRLFFKVPMLPWVPVFGLFLNIYIMYGLAKLTWIRFAIWMVIGELSSLLGVSCLIFFS